MSKGIEFSLIESWDGWDELGVCDLYFYDVKLRESVFGEEFIKSLGDQKIDLSMCLELSVVEIYVSGESEPVLSKKVKLSFIEEE